MGGHRAASAAADPDLRLELLGGFGLLLESERLVVPPTVQRLMSFLAVHRRPVSRLQVCGVLWPESSDDKAAASLRTALWRVPTASGGHPVCATTERLWLSSWVEVDLHRAETVALAAGDGTQAPHDLAGQARALCSHDELLPGWYDDWVLHERERLRQLRLHALDRVGELLLTERRYGDALQVALSSIADEPLRESGHRLAVRTHLAEGNVAEALRCFRSYASVLRREMGLGPSPEMLALYRDHFAVAGVTAGTGADGSRRPLVPAAAPVSAGRATVVIGRQRDQTVDSVVSRRGAARAADARGRA